ncbi:MAG: nicotinate (nicotinamide) nucleotide adenylyltransferase [Chloroflexi bacterium]|nr:MAG: nicotinate (nicotinamide) nucleotide adenylyltransferase [Chloroflexota bacterium]
MDGRAAAARGTWRQEEALTPRIGVFGGTFDPVHVGHLAIALAALESVPLDRVLFVPVRRSPLKDRDPLASTADRVAMLETAIASEPRFALSRAELEREGVSYTVDTLEQLRSQGELFLILGSDALADLARWRAPDRIRELATILVAARPGAPEPGAMHGARAFDAPRLDISSRELRARAARGMSLRYLVPDAVWEHIRRRGLYK